MREFTGDICGARSRALMPIALSAVVMALTSTALADWTQWRGPQGDGIAASQKWSARAVLSSDARAWEMKIGAGYSAPAVKGDWVYIAGWRRGEETIRCINLLTGQERWSQSYEIPMYNNMHAGGPGGSPAVDDKHVYLLDREGTLRCWKADSGELVWERPLAKEFDIKRPQWAFTGSPRMVGDRLLIDVGRIFALDPRTGSDVWKTADYGAGYSTPVEFTHQGKRYLAAIPAYGLVILDLETGKEIAKHRWETAYDVNAATPVIVGDKIFISSGYNTGGALLSFDGSQLKLEWQNREMRNHMATSVAVDGYLYGFDEARLRCVDLRDGSVKWSQRGLGKGTVIVVNNQLVVQSESGELVVAPVSPERFEPVGRMNILQSSRNWTVPVYANGFLLCRSDLGQLVCLKAHQ